MKNEEGGVRSEGGRKGGGGWFRGMGLGMRDEVLGKREETKSDTGGVKNRDIANFYCI